MNTSSRSILVGLAVFLYLPLIYFFGWSLKATDSVDFPSYFHAARLTFVENASPYPTNAFDQATAQMGRKVNGYLYTPPSLLAFWPLAHLSLDAGHRAFLALSHLCFLGSVWILLTRLVPLPEERRGRELMLLFSIVYLFLFDPMIVTLALGQVNLIVLLVLLLALAGIRNGGSLWRVALPLSVAILLKTYPVVLLLPLFFHRRYSLIFLTCICLGLYNALAAFILPTAVWADWWHYVLPKGAYGQDLASAAGPWNQNINAFVTRLMVPNKFSEPVLIDPMIAPVIASSFVALTLGSIAFLSFRISRQKDSPAIQDEELAAWLLTIFLIAPLSWEHHLVYILPATILALRKIICGERNPAVSIAVLCALFLIGRRIPFWEPALTRGWWTLLVSVKFYAALGLWFYFIAALRDFLRRPNAANSDQPAPSWKSHRASESAARLFR